MKNTIYHDVIIKADRTKIFKAFTDPKELVHWWPLECSGIPAKGETYNFYFSDDYDWYGEVATIKQNEALVIQMVKCEENWLPTQFGFELMERDKDVVLQFFHRGWLEMNHEYRKTSYCWALLLHGLKRYVENGEILPFQERA